MGQPGRAGAYVYWQALGDGRPTPGGSDLLGNTFDVSAKSSAAFRHFSRYVRPGAVCVKTTPTALGGADEMDTSNSLDVSAFVHDADRTVTVVLINLRGEPQPLTIRVPAQPKVATYQVLRTSAAESFAEQPALPVADGQVALEVPAYAIVTLYGKE